MSIHSKGKSCSDPGRVLVLNDPAARWTISANQLGEAYANLTGDMLISAGMISYLGTFTMAFRDGIAESWVAQCKEAGPIYPKLFPKFARNWADDDLILGRVVRSWVVRCQKAGTLATVCL
jgi:hypothetical protein